MMASEREQRALAVGVLIGRIRAIQDAHGTAHRALINWGRWSADRRGIFPTLAPPAMWDQFKRDEREDYGEEQEPAVSIEKQPAKAEAPPMPEYNEREAVEIDERIHGYGGLSAEVRLAIRTAYATREVPEEQFPRLSGCGDDAFCERLAECLSFVGRFVG